MYHHHISAAIIRSESIVDSRTVPAPHLPGSPRRTRAVRGLAAAVRRGNSTR